MKNFLFLIAIFFFQSVSKGQDNDFYIIQHPYESIKLNHKSDLEDYPELKQVIEEIKNAINKKSWDDLKANLSKEGGFIEEFQNTFKPENPDSEVWSLLYKAFRINGCIDDEYEDKLHYSAPFVFSKFPEEKVVETYNLQMGDQTNFTTVVGNKVNVRSKPSTKSQVIDQLSFEIVVEVDYGQEKESLDGKYTFSWTKVYTPEGKTGYIYGLFTFNFISDYTARFHKRNGKWVMYAFYNG